VTEAGGPRAVGCCVIISTGFAEGRRRGRRASGPALVGDRAAAAAMRLNRPELHGAGSCRTIAWRSARPFVLDTDRLRDGPISAGEPERRGPGWWSILDRAAADGIGLPPLRVPRQPGGPRDQRDFIEHLVAEPETGAICVYVEGPCSMARRFSPCGWAPPRATRPNPFLIVKTGQDGTPA